MPIKNSDCSEFMSGSIAVTVEFVQCHGRVVEEVYCDRASWRCLFVKTILSHCARFALKHFFFVENTT